MKRTGWLLLFLFFYGTINAQDYLPLIGETNVWYVLKSPEAAWTEIYKTKGDTIIKGSGYKTLGFEYYSTVLGYVREDTTERKVFILPNSIHDSVEIILFDFSLNTNDSINLFSLNYDDRGYYKVDSIGEVKTLVGNRRAIFLSSTEWLHSKPVWVEGIGTLGNIGIREESPSEEYGELSCCFVNGMKMFQSELASTFDTCIIGWSNFKETTANSGVIVFPNPTDSEINIKIPNPGQYSVFIFDLHGRLLVKEYNQDRIDLRDFQNGTYLLKIMFLDKIVSNKFVVLKQ